MQKLNVGANWWTKRFRCWENSRQGKYLEVKNSRENNIKIQFSAFSIMHLPESKRKSQNLWIHWQLCGDNTKSFLVCITCFAYASLAYACFNPNFSRSGLDNLCFRWCKWTINDAKRTYQLQCRDGSKTIWPIYTEFPTSIPFIFRRWCSRKFRIWFWSFQHGWSYVDYQL